MSGSIARTAARSHAAAFRKDFDYRACWSFPVAISSGKVLGSFAMYYKEPREAAVRDLDLASALTRTAATIIQAFPQNGGL